MLLAVVMPLTLLTLLGICVGRQYWRQLSARSEIQPTCSAEGAARLGRRPETSAEMRYEGNGRVYLGQYSVSRYDPVTHTSLRADFSLEAETTCPDEASFQNWIAGHHCLLREQVMIAVRDGETKELTDPNLALLSRKLVARVNRSLDEPFLKSIEFKGFLLYESVQNSNFVLVDERRELSPR